ncbi:DUF2336 domain-containing protein [Kiloniella majae]|uniref:DUF2336 domain-containing protein n=1 Tax=Kiloniella majae TaxID=1938558 RepID=UPI000A27790D|nr:DUF2336 domain-containing protein [Kiloniella majae]
MDSLDIIRINAANNGCERASSAPGYKEAGVPLPENQDNNLQKLLSMALDRSVKGRETLARTIGQLFSEEERVLSELERALMTDILGKLISDVEQLVRQALSEELASTKTVPHELILMLANDDIEVARPILMNSNILQDQDLVDIIKSRTHQHQLSIALRNELSRDVSDALVNTGKKDVIKALLENKNASISELTLEYLADQSRRIDDFQEPLVNREDLPAHLAERMYWWVSAALRSHILKNFPVDIQEIDNKIQSGIHKLVDQDRVSPQPHAPATQLAQKLKQNNLLTVDSLVQALRQGEVELFESMLCEMSGFRPGGLRKALYETKGEGIAILCLAMGIPKQTFATIFLLSRKGNPRGHKTDPRDLSRAMLIYDKVSKDDAQLITDSWRLDPKYQDAISEIDTASTDKKSASGAKAS